MELVQLIDKIQTKIKRRPLISFHNFRCSKEDVFDMRFRICRVHFEYGRREFSTDFLTPDSCSRSEILPRIKNSSDTDHILSIEDTRQDIYVSEKTLKTGSNKKIYIGQCVKDGDFFFSSLSTSSDPCPSGSRSIFSDEVYVYSWGELSS